MNDNSEWVDRRMALLDPAETFAPNGVRAFAKVQARDRHFRVVRRNWIWGTSVAAAVCIVMLAMPTRAICCTKPADAPLPAVQQAVTPPVQTQITPVAAPTQAHADGNIRIDVPASAIRTYSSSYKHKGSPSAPLLIEIYSDFECPACAAFYRDTWPLLVSQYIDTGKVAIVHRDFPLPQHPFARLAARYANAAGELGLYDLAFNRLFETQSEWGANGNIDAALSPVLAPGVMVKVRQMVDTSDPKLDETIATDMAMGTTDHLTQTPTLMIVIAHGENQKVAGVPSFAVLSAYLDELLKGR